MVVDALDSLPEFVAPMMREIAVLVEDEQPAADRKDGQLLLGVFRGNPWTTRGGRDPRHPAADDHPLPDPDPRGLSPAGGRAGEGDEGPGPRGRPCGGPRGVSAPRARLVLSRRHGQTPRMARFTRSDDLGAAEFGGRPARGEIRRVGPDRRRHARGRGARRRHRCPVAAREPAAGQRGRRGPVRRGQLDRRYPGRAQRYAEDPEGLRAAWEVLQATWADVLARAAAMPEGTVDISVGGEWTFAQTLRHLVLATDVWLRRAVLASSSRSTRSGTAGHRRGRRRRPVGLHARAADLRRGAGVRAGRVAMVRDFLAAVTAEELAANAPQPLGAAVPGDHALVPAHDPRGGVGAPALRRAGPRPDRGPARRLSSLVRRSWRGPSR